MTAFFDSQPGSPHEQSAAFPLSSIPAQPLEWLWPNRIPFAHLTILYGLSGLGLSLASLHLAAGPSDNERLLLCPKHTLSTTSPALRFDLTLSPAGIPLLQPLGALTEPGEPIPLFSFQRQHLLRTLREAPAPLSPQALAAITRSSYEATRKMLQRLLHDGDLISPARGLYTTPDHPSLQSPVPTVPDVPTG